MIVQADVHERHVVRAHVRPGGGRPQPLEHGVRVLTAAAYAQGATIVSEHGRPLRALQEGLEELEGAGRVALTKQRLSQNPLGWGVPGAQIQRVTTLGSRGVELPEEVPDQAVGSARNRGEWIQLDGEAHLFHRRVALATARQQEGVPVPPVHVVRFETQAILERFRGCAELPAVMGGHIAQDDVCRRGRRIQLQGPSSGGLRRAIRVTGCDGAEETEYAIALGDS